MNKYNRLPSGTSYKIFQAPTLEAKAFVSNQTYCLIRIAGDEHVSVVTE